LLRDVMPMSKVIEQRTIPGAVISPSWSVVF